jgi:hypothetical protein
VTENAHPTSAAPGPVTENAHPTPAAPGPVTENAHPTLAASKPVNVGGIVRRAVRALGLGALVAVLTPVWFVHDRATRALTRRRDGRIEQIPRIAAARADLDHLMGAGRPVIVEGLTTELGIDTAATRASLVERAGDQTVAVTVHEDAAPYFLYSGGYGSVVREHRTMPVPEFLDMMFDRGVDAGTVVYRLLGPGALGGAAGGIIGEFDRAVAGRTSLRTEPRFSGIWIGSTGVVTPLHHDAWPGLLFQTEGTKRVAMYAPVDRANLYFRTPLAGRGRWSDLPGRSADADPAAFPRVTRAVRHEGVLRAGDALVIPPFWAHEMEAIEPNISVPFRFATPRSGYLDPGFLRPASELLRKQLSG